VQEGDIVLAMTDGVIDNLWEHEVVENVLGSLRKWGEKQRKEGNEDRKADEDGVVSADAEGMQFVAQELLNAARRIAEDPFAQSPYMEKAIDEGLSIEGGMFWSHLIRRSQAKCWH
jgi:hypothetical protein